ncbi:hypothetical protein MVEG_11254 [Podila verticillata NRRL 6337]|uniref:Uncharacterized protein n=1 Tax=Podila verticillata NRRL 6337 TaxID=1069443 RepID=A0A086TLA0_9FUNG|nr:hypothetical protein MVEG_11254 [Podila verticillata NRRL 6337]
MTNSTSFSSRLSSYSTASLSLSSLSYTQFSDSESCTTSSRSPKKKKKSKETHARCMCYLEASLDQQDEAPSTTSSRTAHPSQQYFHHSSPWSWYFQKKQQKETGRLRKIWNDSTIFQWSRPISSSSINRRWIHGRGESQGNSSPTPEMVDGLQRTRFSPSGTDISDEGNHSLSDDEDDASTSMMVNGNRVSFQENGKGTMASRQSRHREDIMAISRYQEAIGQQRNSMDSDIYGAFAEGEMVDERVGNVVPRIVNNFVNDDADDDDDDDDEDWDIQSDSGAPSSKLMYSADAREPTSFSTVTLPLSTPAPGTKSYHKKPSNANLNSLRIRQRCLSLPVDGSGPPGFQKMSSSTPSENWDADFDIESADINVPSKVVENQLSLQMDIYNIKDFALHIEDLKTLRTSLRKASRSLKASNPKKHQDLSKLFQRDWEQAEVIIDLGEIAQTSTVGPTVAAAGPLSLLSGKATLDTSLTSNNISNGGSGSNIGSMRLKRSSLSAMSTTKSSASTVCSKSRSTSTSSTCTGATIVVPAFMDGLADDDDYMTRKIFSSDLESIVESTAIAEPNPRTSVSPASAIKESYSSPAGLGLCTSPVRPLDTEHQRMSSNGQAEVDASLRRYQKYRHSKSRSRHREASSSIMSGVGDLTGYYDDNDFVDEEDDGYESYGHAESGSLDVISPIPTDRHMQVLKDILMEGLGSDVARQFMFKQGEQDHVRFSVEVIPGLLGHLKGLQKRLGDQLLELERVMIVQ